jgi:hypothetical protein
MRNQIFMTTLKKSCILLARCDSLPSTVRVIKWRRLGWVGYMGEQDSVFWLENIVDHFIWER